jgi:hypothetical protein
MGIQFGHQTALNQQGHDLQMDMWKKTNYPAQVKMLEQAGLNPALLYGMGGAGGSTTGSQGGGSAAGGSAPGQGSIDLPMAMMGAQIENIKADTEKKKHEGRLAGLNADEQDIVLSYADSNEQYKNAKLFEELNEAKEKAKSAKEDRISKEILNNLKKEGLLDNGASINWFSSRIGLDVSKPNFMDKKVPFFSEKWQNRLKEWGVDWNPGMTVRQLMVILEGQIAVGKLSIKTVKFGIQEFGDILSGTND